MSDAPEAPPAAPAEETPAEAPPAEGGEAAPAERWFKFLIEMWYKKNVRKKSNIFCEKTHIKNETWLFKSKSSAPAGPSQPSENPTFTLFYFNVKALAEPIRFLFAYGAQEYEDVRVTRDEWPALKPSKQIVFIKKKIQQTIELNNSMNRKQQQQQRQWP